jgi:hypothetical protein
MTCQEPRSCLCDEPRIARQHGVIDSGQLDALGLGNQRLEILRSHLIERAALAPNRIQHRLRDVLRLLCVEDPARNCRYLRLEEGGASERVSARKRRHSPAASSLSRSSRCFTGTRTPSTTSAARYVKGPGIRSNSRGAANMSRARHHRPAVSGRWRTGYGNQ